MKKNIIDELIVVKRSGQRVDFNSYKIVVAIKRAFDSVYENYDSKDINKVYEDVLLYIETNYHDRKTINVEDIQDIIETKLKEKKYIEVFNSFSQYRRKRAASRKVFTKKSQHKFIKAMEKIAEDSLLTKETDFSALDIINSYGKTVVNEFSKSHIIDNKFLRIHEEGNIYIHNIDNFALGMIPNVHLICDKYLNNCDLDTLIQKSRLEISEKINIPALDYLLEQYFLKEYITKTKELINDYLDLTGFKEYLNIKKIYEVLDKQNEINQECNIFKHLNFNENVEKIIEKAQANAIIKTEKIFSNKITDFFSNLNKMNDISFSFGTNNSPVGHIINNLIIKALLQNEFYNLKITFKIKEEYTYLDKIKELIQNGYELNINFINATFNKSHAEIEYFDDGVRVFENFNSNHEESKGKLVVAKTSINLVRLALNNKNIKDFYKELDGILELVKNNLLLLFETIGDKTPENYKILFKNNIFDDEKLEAGQKIRKVIKNGTLLIGLVGLAQAVNVYTEEDEKKYKLINEILKYINKKISSFTEETKLNFQIFEPAEEKVRKEFIILDKSIYGKIKNITDNTSYNLITNMPYLKDDYKKVAEIQKNILGGAYFEIPISKNISYKKIDELFVELKKSNIGFVKLIQK